MEYPIPEFDGYFLTDECEVVSYKGKHRRVMRPQVKKHLTVYWRYNTFYSLRQNNKNKCVLLQRIILAVQLGRWPYA